MGQTRHPTQISKDIEIKYEDMRKKNIYLVQQQHQAQTVPTCDIK